MVKNMRGVTYNFKQSGDESSKGEKEKKTKPLKHGFIAQELEAVAPSLVSTDELGNKFVGYDGIIPILLEALKEQQTQIDKLEKEVTNAILNSKSLTDSNTANKLFQNTPNPFTSYTSIQYQLDQNAVQATIYVYDFQGTQLKKYILDRNDTKLTLEANQLRPGVYLYALVVDGKEVDIKRMLLTE
jgi:hypothetical protein